MTVRIVSYNLLVPVYAEQLDYYIKCQPEFLKLDYRWNLIQSELKEEINQHENTILCLQELSLTMLPKLELLLRQCSYSLFHNLYGGQWNDYMGVGIAIPMSMSLASTSYMKIGDHIRSLCKRRENTTTTTNSSDAIESTTDPWQTAMDRPNTLICLRVFINGKALSVGTYHMPCYYKESTVMAIHSSVVKDLMFQFADGNNLILAGDFNLEPKDTAYRALIEKDYRDVHFPESDVYDVRYQLHSEQVMKSAYREKNGSEPVYTTFAQTADSPPYCETLDYVFYAGQLTVESVLKLPDQPTGQSYPDENHPSDHLMIAATFLLA